MTVAVALVTYSTKPRGGVVHTLALAEALVRQAAPVEVVALGDPAVGFFRRVDAPLRLIPAPEPRDTLEERVAAAVDALADGLRLMRAEAALPPICTCRTASRRAAVRCATKGAGHGGGTVHHVDDFTTPELVECQLRSILDPDRLVVVAGCGGAAGRRVRRGRDCRHQRRRQRALLPSPPPEVIAGRRAGRRGRRFLVLTVGGIEPRKGSDHLVRALALMRGRMTPSPVLAVIGGHSFQDHRAYRETVLDSLPGLGLELGRDVVLLGTLPDDEMPGWYHAADAFAFPSVNEGFGLVVLEALAAGTPTVVADLPAFREYLTYGRDALVVTPGDDQALAEQHERIARDPALRSSLAAAGRTLADRFTWSACADQHLAIYRALGASP